VHVYLSNLLHHKSNQPLFSVLYLQVGNWQLLCYHLGRYWSEYCRAEAMSIWVLGVISCTAVQKK
jgi:hypothetical protein